MSNRGSEEGPSPHPTPLSLRPLTTSPEHRHLLPLQLTHIRLPSISPARPSFYSHSITYTPGNESYSIYHNVSGSTTWQVTSSIPIQKDHSGQYKNYSIAYFVYEKVANVSTAS